MGEKNEMPEGMILYPKTVVELLHIRRQFNRGIPMITVFEVEAQNFKYGKEAYFQLIKKQIKRVFKFTLFKEKEVMPLYYNDPLNGSAEGEEGEGKVTEYHNDYNEVYYYYYNHEIEAKLLNELLEYLQDDTTHKERAHEVKPKQGRPKTIIHDASYYLYNKGLLQFLIDNYSNIKAHIFNQLIKALIDLGQLKTASNKEYKEAFGNALNIKQSQTNFDNAIKNAATTIFEPIKTKITTYLEQQRVV